MSGYPSVTIEQIESKIVSERYFTAAEGVEGAYAAGGGVHPHGGTPSKEEHTSLGLLTFCVLVLDNGHTIVGKSACVSAKNFDAALGRKYAREDAIRQMWPLEGYLLSERLCEHKLRRTLFDAEAAP